MSDRKSLQDYYPSRYEVPILIIASAILQAVALSLPLFTVEKSVFWRHWKNSYSVFTGCVGLWRDEEHVLAAVIFFFSIVFPAVKLAALWLIWDAKLGERRRNWILHWLGLLGKWSMLDVFVVAVIVVAAKMETLTRVEPQVGIYVFGVSVFLSMLTTMHVSWLARRSMSFWSKVLSA
ncbi:MAG: paraquat-inducible protein A [Candidatus Omnitrophica bacterium]|nr:paraquat-inducible protein A [Candidatus Omnitrophota bacterium]